MSDLHASAGKKRGVRLTHAMLWVGLLTWNLSGHPARTAAEEPKSADSATCVSEKATLLRRPKTEKTWHVVDQKETLPSGDLIVGLPGAILDSPKGAVRLTLRSDFDELAPYPIKETALRLEDNPKVDLDFTLDRGRVELKNQKESGAAHVRVHVRKVMWDLTLVEPGARIALELYGRWPRGVPFTKEPDAKHEPTASLVFVVLQGEVVLDHDGYAHTLKAPPGPALIEWDSVSGQDQSPQRLAKLPAWAEETGDSPKAKMKKEVLERFRQAVAEKSLDSAVEEFLSSDKPIDRVLAIYVTAALDDFKHLAPALREAKKPEIREHGILALRHWIGRAPGQDQLLYKGLIEQGKFKPIHAETVLQLLHSYGEPELARPETYQALIDYLEHEKLIIRTLASWHLDRLVPAGRKFAYSPVDSADKRAEAVAKWKELIPPGTVPNQTEPETKKPSSAATDK